MNWTLPILHNGNIYLRKNVTYAITKNNPDTLYSIMFNLTLLLPTNLIVCLKSINDTGEFNFARDLGWNGCMVEEVVTAVLLWGD